MGIECLAPELDRNLGRIARHRGQQHHLDTLVDGSFFRRFLLEQLGNRLDKAVGNQNTEEGTDKGTTDHFAKNRGRRTN